MSTLNQTGLTIDSLQDIITFLGDSYKEIYGNDIIIDSNSPDGQLINIYAQFARDILEVLEQINAGFDIDQAVGVVLDQRVSLLGLVRQGATFTQQQVSITVDRALTLEGLDAAANDPEGTGYTVADDSGQEYILLDTINITSPGTQLLTFRAKELGSITSLANTITNAITEIIGVIAINNPTGALEVGLDGELDAALKLRAKRSPANRSKGFIDGLTGTLLNIEGVTDARVYENFSDVTDANLIPAHSIWVICEGGANTDIANVIYTTKNAGCGMKGAVSVDITTINGSLFTALFDRPNSASLWIRFEIQATTVGQSFDETGIKSYIVNNLDYAIGENSNTSAVTIIAQQAVDTTSGGGVVLNAEISDDDVAYVDFLSSPSLDSKWIVDSARISITVL